MVAIIAACGAGGPRGVSHHTKPLRNSSSAPSEITGRSGS
jgi:hypothetical protein